MAADMKVDNEIKAELPYIRQYKNGTIEFPKGSAVYVYPPNSDPTTGVSYKDVTIDSKTGVQARLYLPKLKDKDSGKKIPILLYFHGGGFFTESALHKNYHDLLNAITSESNILAVSVEYRLAPCHPLPAAYDDSLTALQWVLSKQVDEWVTEHGDLGRIFFCGDSAGANIVNQLAMRKEVTNSNYNIQGVVLLCPYFWGSKSIGEEGKDPLKKVLVDIGWKFVMGWNSNMTLDDPRVNPIAEGSPSLAGLTGKKALVIVADEDYLRFRGKAYYEELVKSSWGGKPELKVYDGVGHVFFLGHLDSKESKDLLASLAAFFN